MKKKNDCRIRIPEMIIAMMLSVMLTVSGAAPSFIVFAEESGDAGTQTEGPAPASEENAAEAAPAPQPAPQSAAGPEAEHAAKPAAEPAAVSEKQEAEPVSAAASAEPAQEATADSTGDSTGGQDPPDNTNNENNASAADTAEDTPAAAETAPEDAGNASGTDAEAADDDAEDSEIRYPAQSFSAATSDLKISVSAAEGVFPEGTQMKARAADASEVMDAARRLAPDGTEIVDAAAADITFSCGGAEIQPRGSVRVKLTARRTLRGDSHEAVTVNGSGRASVISDASADSASFRTDHFTVYGIIGTEDEPADYEDDIKRHARRTYEFYAGAPSADRSSWVKVDTQILRDGETLSLPAEPAGDAKNLFSGWYTEGTNEKLADGYRVSIAEGSADETVKVYAAFSIQYRITLYSDESMRSVFDSILAPDGSTEVLPSVETAMRRGLIVPDHRRMLGWKMAGSAGGPLQGNSVTVEGADIELVPCMAKAHDVRFDLVKEAFRTTPLAEQRVLDGDRVEKPANYTEGNMYKGYTFGGWYLGFDSSKEDIDEAFTDAFDFDHELTAADSEDILLYAKWIPAEVKFTVEIWQENAHAHEAEFRLAESVRMDGLSESIVPAADILAAYGRDRYEWFHWSSEGAVNGSSERPVIEVVNATHTAAFDTNGSCLGDERNAGISPDGSTVVKLYYCRDTFRINFLFANKGTPPAPKIVSGGTVFNSINNTRTEVGRSLNETGKALAPEGYGDAALPVIDAKYGEWLHECTHITNTQHSALFDAFLDDPVWYFERQDFNGMGETVFDGSNKRSPVKPNSKIADGGDLYCLIYLKSGQKLYRAQALYYDRDYTAEQLAQGGIDPSEIREVIHTWYVAAGDYGHGHSFSIGSVTDGYRLVSVTGYDKVQLNCRGAYRDEMHPLPEGEHKFYWKNGKLTDGDPEMIHLHYVPETYSITFRQTGHAGRVHGWHISADTAAEDVVIDGIFCGQEIDIGGIISDRGLDTGLWTGLRDDHGRSYKAADAWHGDTEADGSFPDRMPARDLVFYRSWNSDCYSVTFDLNGHSVDEKEIHHYHGIAWGGSIPDPEREGLTDRDGHELIRWHAFTRKGDGTAGDAIEDFRMNTAVRHDVYLRAVWMTRGGYTVEYDQGEHGMLEGANGSGRLTDSKVYMHDAGAPVRYVPSADEGWVFTGWALGGSAGRGTRLYGSGDMISYSEENDAAGAMTEEEAEDCRILLVAQYERTGRQTGVSYHSNYPSGSDRVVSLDGLTVNGRFTIAGPDDPELGFGSLYTADDGTAYVFVCWTSSSGETIHSGSPGREYFRPGEAAAAGFADNHLYAVWRPVVNAEETYRPPQAESMLIITGTSDTADTEDSILKSLSSERLPAGPATGDETGLIIYVSMMAAAVIAAAAILIGRRGRRPR